MVVCAFVLSPIALAVFWIFTKEFRYGVLAAFIVFCAGIVISAGVMSTIREPSVFMTWAPFAGGIIYTVVPDLMPLPFDDAAAVAAGAIATFALWLKRQPDMPKAAVLPLLFGALYTLVGMFIPGPVDELLVNGIAVAASVALAGRPDRQISAPVEVSVISEPPPDDEKLL